MFIISWAVTFSVQVVMLMGLWTLASLLYRDSSFLKITQSALVLYGAIICTVFYGIIVPWNGWSSTRLDAVIHILVPGLFALRWYVDRGQFARMQYKHFMLYPMIYLVFVLCISHHRGYLVYPFLDNVPALVVVGLAFSGIYKLSQV